MRRWGALASGVMLVGLCAPVLLGGTPPASASSSTGSAWAGFSLEDTAPKNLTTVTSSWVVPQVSCVAGQTTKASEWVGMGGQYVSALQKFLRWLADSPPPGHFEPLYQAGTETDCNDGHATYSAWQGIYSVGHEVPPDPVSGTVDAGDNVSVSLSFTSGGHGSWSMTDTRTGSRAWGQSGTWSHAPDGFHSSECIVEDPVPVGGGRARLADFSVVDFGGCTTASAASGSTDVAEAPGAAALPNLWTRKRLRMEIASKVLAVPAINPLRVVHGDSTSVPSLPASKLLSLFSDATLPAGVCAFPGQTPSGPIPISSQDGGLEGESAPFGSPNYYSVSVDTPIALDLGDGRGNEVGAALWCSAGGTASYSGVWVFAYANGQWVVDFGPLSPRSYEEVGGLNDFGAGVTSLANGERSFSAAEEYGEPGDCGGCASGKASTTWTWSSSDPDHLVISNPKPVILKLTKMVTPGGLGGGAGMGNQLGPAIAAGAKVNAICTGESSADASLWVELDTGGWIPGDAVSALPPDCDGGQAIPLAGPCPSSAISAFTTTATSGAPPGSDESATVTNSACDGSWALGYGQLSFGPSGSGPEGWFTLLELEQTSGPWSNVEGPDDGTCLVQTNDFGCPFDSAGGVPPPPAIPQMVMAELVAVSGLEYNPETGTVTPPGVSPGNG